MLKKISSQNGCSEVIDSYNQSVDSAKPFKHKKNRRQFKQIKDKFKSFKYQENKHFKEKQNIESQQYDFQRKNQKNKQSSNKTLQKSQQINHNENQNNFKLFISNDIIQFDDYQQDQQGQEIPQRRQTKIKKHQFQIQDQQIQKKQNMNNQQLQKQQQQQQERIDIKLKLTSSKVSNKLLSKKNNSQNQIQSQKMGLQQFDLQYQKKQQFKSNLQFLQQARNQGGNINQRDILRQSSNCQNSNIKLKYAQHQEQYEFNDNFQKRFSQKNNNKKKRIKPTLHDPNQLLEKLFVKKNVDELSQILNGCEIQVDQQIKGLKILTDSNSNQIKIQIINKKKFVQSPLPPGITFECTLRKSNSFLNIINPQFDLYITNGLKHIISAKKYSFKNRELFRFSLNIGDYQHTIGKLNANLLHNQYWLTGKQIQMGYKQIRSNLSAAIKYQNFNKGDKQRKFTAILPPITKKMSLAINYRATQIDMQWLKKEVKLILKNMQNIQKFQNQKKIESKKNFILYDGQDQQYPFLKCMKKADNIFHLEISHPLSPLQAMAIALTRFDAQLK